MTRQGCFGYTSARISFVHRRCPIIQTAAGAPDLSLYGGTDPRDAPRYTFPEAARAVGIPSSTLRAWTVGQRYRRKQDHGFFFPVLTRPEAGDARLSFLNLIEAHIVRALRTVHEVSLSTIREAIHIAETALGVERLLLDPRLKTSARQLFLDRYTDAVELSASQQIALRAILEQYLERIEYDQTRLPARFFPLPRAPRDADAKIILITPFVSFGRAIIQSTGVSTRAIAQRLDAGEALETVRSDYGLTDAEIEEAALFEAAA